jgi:zinc-ribbon family
MVVIFGFGAGQPEDLGEAVATVCPNCHNQVVLHHVRSKKKVSLYFVPVVPYGTDDYLVCPVCSRGMQLSKTQLPHVAPMKRTTASFRAGRLSEVDYAAQADRFWRAMGVHVTGQPMAPGGPGVARSSRHTGRCSALARGGRRDIVDGAAAEARKVA